MDMNTDVVNIASRRLQVDSVKPVTQHAQTPVEERLIPHTAADTDTDVKHKRHDEQSAGRKPGHDHQSENEGSEDPEVERYSGVGPHIGEDGEEHMLDVRV